MTMAHITPETLLRSPALLRALDARVRRADPRRLGFYLADADAPDLAAIRVHVRHYLRVPGMPDGYRTDAEPVCLPDLGELPGYSVAFLVPRDVPQAPQVMQYVARAMEQEETYEQRLLMVRPTASGQGFEVFQDGAAWLPVPVSPLPVGVEPGLLALRVGNDGGRRFDVTLPARVEVDLPFPRGSVALEVEDGQGFDMGRVECRLESASGRDVGACSLYVDADLEPGNADHITVTGAGLDEDVRLQAGNRPQAGRGDPLAGGADVVVHVVFDRTTLDADAFPLALAAADGAKTTEDDEEAFDVRRDPTTDFNRRFRQALAPALQSAMDRVLADARIQLYWFADIPRHGLASPIGLPVAPQAAGRIGQVAPGQLEQVLGENAHLHFATGIDLFDAVDVALDDVASVIDRSHGRRRHLVVVVGDSPPPPRDESDPLWALLERPRRSNGRTSPLFHDSLKRLSDLGAPVGWMFMRDLAAPGSGQTYAGLTNLHTQFCNQRELVLEALEQVPTLRVRQAGCHEELTPALEELLEDLVTREVRFPEAPVAAVLPAEEDR